MADAEIIFFMNDLGSVRATLTLFTLYCSLTYRVHIVGAKATATTSDGLFAQQAKLTQTMGYIDYQFARVTVHGTYVAEDER